MKPSEIIFQLENNITVFEGLLQNQPSEVHLFKPRPEKWCLLEIVCHLFDEEREDFRARVKSVLYNPDEPLKAIDPVDWVLSRNYMQQDYHQKVEDFIREREKSIDWLNNLENPNWENTFQHSKLGPMSAYLFLSNWLAHDYMHIRQINRTKYAYLNQNTTDDIWLDYAGKW